MDFLVYPAIARMGIRLTHVHKVRVCDFDRFFSCTRCLPQLLTHKPTYTHAQPPTHTLNKIGAGMVIMGAALLVMGGIQSYINSQGYYSGPDSSSYIYNDPANYQVRQDACVRANELSQPDQLNFFSLSHE